METITKKFAIKTCKNFTEVCRFLEGFNFKSPVYFITPDGYLTPLANLCVGCIRDILIDEEKIGFAYEIDEAMESYDSSDHFCNDCKYFKEYDTMTFLTYNCSKNKEAVNFWQVACDDFEAKEEK